MNDAKIKSLARMMLAALPVLAACGGAAVATPPPGTENSAAHAAYASSVPKISLSELEQRLQSKPAETFVFDANGAEEYAAGHIPKAKHVSYDQVKPEALPSDKAAFVVFYCWNEQCGASHQAAEAAMKLGYNNVHVYGGGIEGWKKAGKNLEK
jgi:rhodanese-related sulfurtransferase